MGSAEPIKPMQTPPRLGGGRNKVIERDRIEMKPHELRIKL